MPLPASYSLFPKAAAVPSMFCNDRLGCCVVAGRYHEIGVATGNAGAPFVATDAQVVADYSAISGYNPSDPSTDQGCNEQDALTWWTKNKAADGSQLSGFVHVDAANPDEVKAAIWLGGCLYLGMELPDSWINPFPGPGFVWEAADPDPSNGHCVAGFSYDSVGVGIVSWGTQGKVTWDALARCAVSSAGGEAWALIDPDTIVRGQASAPNGLDWSSLSDDILKIPAMSPKPVPWWCRAWASVSKKL